MFVPEWDDEDGCLHRSTAVEGVSSSEGSLCEYVCVDVWIQDRCQRSMCEMTRRVEWSGERSQVACFGGRERDRGSVWVGGFVAMWCGGVAWRSVDGGIGRGRSAKKKKKKKKERKEKQKIEKKKKKESGIGCRH